MAGLLSLIFLAFAGHGIAKDEINKAKYTDYSKHKANENGDVYYEDGWGKTKSTQTNEPVNVMHDGSASVVVGKYSGKVYQAKLSEEKLEELRLERAIEYCKENGIKYLPWHFYTNARPQAPGDMGIDIETGYRYLVYDRSISSQKEYTYILLNNKPSRVYHPCHPNGLEVYQALENGTERMEKERSKALHDRNLELYDSLPIAKFVKYEGTTRWYYTQEFRITEEEYNERKKEVEEFPMFIKY